MSSEPQEPSEPETTERDEPNEFGFAGAATSPTPERETGEGFGEDIAVPAGDLTGALMEAIEDVGRRHEHDQEGEHKHD